jgi:hypothetical protein
MTMEATAEASAVRRFPTCIALRRWQLLAQPTTIGLCSSLVQHHQNKDGGKIDDGSNQQASGGDARSAKGKTRGVIGKEKTNRKKSDRIAEMQFACGRWNHKER